MAVGLPHAELLLYATVCPCVDGQASLNDMVAFWCAYNCLLAITVPMYKSKRLVEACQVCRCEHLYRFNIPLLLYDGQ